MALETVRIETDFGPIEWKAHPDVFKRSGPLLLMIRGAFADPASLGHMPECVEIDCAMANLPGHSTPPLVANSVGVLAAGFRQSIQEAFPARPLVVLGLSIGGLVAMALRLPQIVSLVLVDPPLRTEGLWPMEERIRKGWATLPPHLRDFCWQVFGVNKTTIEARDYSELARALTTPADVMLGGIALHPKRQLDTTPCLNAPDAFEGLVAVRRHIMPEAGHNIPAQAPEAFIRLVREACDAAR